MTTKTSKPLILTTAMLTLVFAITSSTAFATHEQTGASWTEPNQEFFCHSSLSNLNITSTVTLTTCDIIINAASDWTNVSNSDWELTQSTTSKIDFKSGNLGSSGNVGKMNHYAILGTIITASVEFNTNSDFGDSTSDSNVYDIYTLVKHEMGHLPTMYHNAHNGDISTSVMRTGNEIGYDSQRNISSNDESALANKY